jgi:hypothetical protein
MKLLGISSIFVPSVIIPMILYFRNYSLLITAIPVSITSIVYHNHIYIPYINFENIRKIDYFMAHIAYTHLVIIPIYYNNIIVLLYQIPGIVFFKLSMFFYLNNHIIISTYFHLCLHLYIIYGVYNVNILLNTIQSI